jgi:hypothetical protein
MPPTVGRFGTARKAHFKCISYVRETEKGAPERFEHAFAGRQLEILEQMVPDMTRVAAR